MKNLLKFGYLECMINRRNLVMIIFSFLIVLGINLASDGFTFEFNSRSNQNDTHTSTTGLTFTQLDSFLVADGFSLILCIALLGLLAYKLASSDGLLYESGAFKHRLIGSRYSLTKGVLAKFLFDVFLFLVGFLIAYLYFITKSMIYYPEVAAHYQQLFAVILGNFLIYGIAFIAFIRALTLALLSYSFLDKDKKYMRLLSVFFVFIILPYSSGWISTGIFERLDGSIFPVITLFESFPTLDSNVLRMAGSDLTTTFSIEGIFIGIIISGLFLLIQKQLLSEIEV